jgi:hypothetical protein
MQGLCHEFFSPHVFYLDTVIIPHFAPTLGYDCVTNG